MVILASCKTQNAPKNDALAGSAAEASVRAEGSFESDSATLPALYNKTQGSDWFRHRAWLTSAPLDQSSASYFAPKENEDINKSYTSVILFN